MRASYVALLSLPLAACISTPGVHPTLHPAAPGSGPNAGVAIGALIQNADESTSTNVGYGEGWARLGPTGAFEVRTTPQAAFLAYDFPLSEGATALSLRPSFGAAVVRFSQPDAMGNPDESTVGVVHPGASLVINAGDFYAAPRLGLSRSFVIEGDDDGATAYSFAGTVGIRLANRMSLELTAVYSRDTDDPPDSVWTIVPSFGVAVGN
ncbi:MAG TPA: hypothetical protein VIV11_07470 [Kofleriaceae bacterium]